MSLFSICYFKACTTRILMLFQHAVQPLSPTNSFRVNPPCQSFARPWETVAKKTPPLPSKDSQPSWEHVLHVLVGAWKRC